jgi:hypothetical protein
MELIEIAGIRIPDSRLARQALELTRETSSEWLVHHALRTYVFGSLLAAQKGWEVDAELFFLGAVLHDLGITERGHGPQRFEVEGADWAERFLIERGLPTERAAIVWDAIALHTSRGIADRKAPEIALVHLGAMMDVAGVGLDALPRTELDETLDALPRLGFKTSIVDAFARTIQANPGTAIHTFVTDLARTCVPGFVCPSMQSLIEGAPFVE